MSTSARSRSAVAVLVTAAAGGLVALSAVFMAAPAQAAACSGTSGVTVLVEWGALGGGADVDCEPDGGGRTADRLLKDAGHAVTYVQRFPGFVCRIDGAPADDPCVNTPPADAYWGLWWSDGKSGEWTYSSLGASSLDVPDGGYVAMVWDGSSGTVRPSTAATPHRRPSPSPTPKPTPTKKPTTQAPTAAPTPASTPPEPTSAPSPTKKPKPTKTPTASPSDLLPEQPSGDPSEEQTDAGAPIDDPVDPQSATESDGLPPWVAPVVVVLLLGAAGGVAVARRRRLP